MSQKIISVPREKCPLDVLADMKERTNLADIFFSPAAADNLIETADIVLSNSDTSLISLLWNETEEYSMTSVFLERKHFEEPTGVQYQVLIISADDIAFRHKVDKPTVNYFLDKVF